MVYTLISSYSISFLNPTAEFRFNELNLSDVNLSSILNTTIITGNVHLIAALHEKCDITKITINNNPVFIELFKYLDKCKNMDESVKEILSYWFQYQLPIPVTARQDITINSASPLYDVISKWLGKVNEIEYHISELFAKWNDPASKNSFIELLGSTEEANVDLVGH